MTGEECLKKFQPVSYRLDGLEKAKQLARNIRKKQMKTNRNSCLNNKKKNT